jgi:hypothetical protein
VAPGGPVKLAFVDVDRYLVDTRLPPPHQPLIVKLPEFIAVGPKPLIVDIVVLVLESNGDSIFCETPQ